MAGRGGRRGWASAMLQSRAEASVRGSEVAEICSAGGSGKGKDTLPAAGDRDGEPATPDFQNSAEGSAVW